MLSIDEAIAFERQQAEDRRNVHYAFGIQKSKEAAEEHEQIAEWLKELKILREEKSEFQILAKDIAEYNYEMGMESGYNKALDDAKSVIMQTLDNEILVDTLHLRLEQLKERNNE